jgi:hypothetical protein
MGVKRRIVQMNSDRSAGTVPNRAELIRTLIKKVREKVMITDAETLFLKRVGFKLPAGFEVWTREKMLTDARDHKTDGGNSIGVLSSWTGKTADKFLGRPWDPEYLGGSTHLQVLATDYRDDDPFYDRF